VGHICPAGHEKVNVAALNLPVHIVWKHFEFSDGSVLKVSALSGTNIHFVTSEMC
jgi:hypothetical protein